MKVIKAIYNFIVGDMVILIGVIVIMALLAMFSYIPALSMLKAASGTVLIVAVLVILWATLNRETHSKR